MEATPETQPFWDALADGRLIARRCAACGTVQRTPRLVCRCGSEEGAWFDLPATARLESFTTVAHAPHDQPALPSPYTLGLVSFPAVGHQMLALITHAGPLAVGDALTFAPFRSGDTILPGFVPASEDTR
ncbi:Zn-ribbon domain-containing OB-fold protein [Acuticoccus kandeliae]|uniref:Zn-ribbon domain-containing OB-fold protein n=1 Tax=Acuticoccus kandeliae TaxID=2073160 RepID=UPI00147396E6|nr:zinc ribbon domain-containing protein [Acuticoccus kandeliae]